VTEVTVRPQTSFHPFSGPSYGKIQNANHDIKSFRAMDLKLGQLKYIHDGSKTKTDIVVFQAHDGWQTLTVPVMIQIEEKEDKTAVLVNNNVFNVDIRQRKKILPKDLWARSKTRPDGELVITLTPSSNNPLHGKHMSTFVFIWNLSHLTLNLNRSHHLQIYSQKQIKS
jgi:hypothetical protein